VTRSGFRIGRIFGISIRVDWSWLLIFFLVSWNLSSLLGQTHEDWGAGMHWALAIGAALLFFASVLAHELAHSLVARAQGTPVANITLFLFGGVSNIQREPDSPKNEFWMAILGPITSFVVGAIFLGLALISAGPIEASWTNPTEALAQLSPLAILLGWLGSVNITLGLFNLIPGFPLDGGRVLRSILWAASDNLRRATRWASWVGQGIAWLMILGGIAMVFGASIPLFGSGLTNGVWLIFIGWFLHNASTRSYQQVVIQDILEDVPVQHLMRSDPPTVPPNISVGSLVHSYVMRMDDYAFPVVDGDRLVGIVTLEDVRAVPREEWERMAVQGIMTPRDRLITIAPSTDAAEALQKLAQHDVRQLPVLQDGNMVGLLRRRDITKWLQLHSELAKS
jgi:Zn-dependent protease/predicted transcriptional regulator